MKISMAMKRAKEASVFVNDRRQNKGQQEAGGIETDQGQGRRER